MRDLRDAPSLISHLWSLIWAAQMSPGVPPPGSTWVQLKCHQQRREEAKLLNEISLFGHLQNVTPCSIMILRTRPERDRNWSRMFLLCSFSFIYWRQAVSIVMMLTSIALLGFCCFPVSRHSPYSPPPPNASDFVVSPVSSRFPCSVTSPHEKFTR